MENLHLDDLDQAQYLLERMLDLAKTSAGEDCTDQRRAVLQKGFAFLQEEVVELLEKTNEEDT